MPQNGVKNNDSIVKFRKNNLCDLRNSVMSNGYPSVVSIHEKQIIKSSYCVGCIIHSRKWSQDEIIEKDSPKPTKKKRHIVGKVIIGLAIAWGVVVVIFIASYGAAQH